MPSAKKPESAQQCRVYCARGSTDYNVEIIVKRSKQNAGWRLVLLEQLAALPHAPSSNFMCAPTGLVLSHIV